MLQLILPKKQACASVGVMPTTQEEHRHGCCSTPRPRGDASPRAGNFPLPSLWHAWPAQDNAHALGPRYRVWRDSLRRNHCRRVPRSLFLLQDLSFTNPRDRTPGRIHQSRSPGSHRPLARRQYEHGTTPASAGTRFSLGSVDRLSLRLPRLEGPSGPYAGVPTLDSRKIRHSSLKATELSCSSCRTGRWFLQGLCASVEFLMSSAGLLSAPVIE